MDGPKETDFTWTVQHKLDILNAAVDQAQISSLLGLVPQWAWNRGDPHTRPGRPPFTFSRWIYRTPEWSGDTAGMNRREHVAGLRALVDHIHSRRQVIEALRPAEITVVTAVHSGSFNVAYQLPVDCARQLGEIGVPWCVDTYLAPGVGSLFEDDEPET